MEITHEFSESSGFKWVVDIIDYFLKFMGSFPVVDNNANNVLNGIKEFCYYVGFPKIIQMDNGSKYNNILFTEFCDKHNIKHINSRPRHPQTNGMV